MSRYPNRDDDGYDRNYGYGYSFDNPKDDDGYHRNHDPTYFVGKDSINPWPITSSHKPNSDVATATTTTAIRTAVTATSTSTFTAATDKDKDNKTYIIIRYNKAGKAAVVETKYYSSRELAIIDAKYLASQVIRKTSSYQLKERDYLDLMNRVEAVNSSFLSNKVALTSHQLNLAQLQNLKVELAKMRDDIDSYDQPTDVTSQRLLGSGYDRDTKTPIFIVSANSQRYPDCETYAVYQLSQ